MPYVKKPSPTMIAALKVIASAPVVRVGGETVPVRTALSLQDRGLVTIAVRRKYRSRPRYMEAAITEAGLVELRQIGAPPPVRLGEFQRRFLHALVEHGLWWSGCGWLWKTPHETVRQLESLVRRGLAERTEVEHRSIGVGPRRGTVIYTPYMAVEYRPTDAGRSVALGAM